jgi:erythritol transport system permease protein
MSEASLSIRQNKAAKQTIRRDPRMMVLRLRTLIALFILVVIFAFTAPAFLTTGNIIILVKQVALNAILGIGMTFVILTGGIDLSVGSIVGLAGMIAGGLITEGLILPMFGVSIFFNIPLVIVITLIVGMLVGLLNGLIITRLNVTPFIATLGMLYMARSAALLRSNGATFPNLVGNELLGNTGFPAIGAGTLLGLPWAIWIMVVFIIIATFVATKTPFGRQVYAVGGNERAAELSGVRVNRVKVLTYMISGFCAAVVGLIITSQLVAAHPATGTSYELNAIAVVVLGGASLNGGRGNVLGTIIGAFVIGVLNNGMVLIGLSEFAQTGITGFVIVAAVVLDQFQQHLQRQLALQQATAQVIDMQKGKEVT